MTTDALRGERRRDRAYQVVARVGDGLLRAHLGQRCRLTREDLERFLRCGPGALTELLASYEEVGAGGMASWQEIASVLVHSNDWRVRAFEMTAALDAAHPQPFSLGRQTTEPAPPAPKETP